jgi:hypothetical protein
MMTRRWRVGVKLLLAAATVVAMLSYGGLLIFAFLPLAVGFWWAVRCAGVVERLAWIVLGSVAAAQWAWEITYPVTAGDSPASWIVSSIAGMTMGALLWVGVRYKLTRSQVEVSDGRSDGASTAGSAVLG